MRTYILCLICFVSVPHFGGYFPGWLFTKGLLLMHQVPAVTEEQVHKGMAIRNGTGIYYCGSIQRGPLIHPSYYSGGGFNHASHILFPVIFRNGNHENQSSRRETVSSLIYVR